MLANLGKKNFDSVHTGGGQDPKRPEMAPARPRPKRSWPDAFFNFFLRLQMSQGVLFHIYKNGNILFPFRRENAKIVFLAVFEVICD